MRSSTIFTTSARVKLCALAVAVLLAAGSIVWARHQDNDMQNMPGMKIRKPKAKSKSRRKVRSKARSSARRKQSAGHTPKKHDMRGMNMNGMDMRGMQMPTKSPTPTPSPSAGQTRMENMPGMKTPTASPTPAPAASPQKMDMQNMPGMQMPAASPTPAPQASPSPGQKMDMAMPINMPMNNQTPHASPSPAASTDTSGGMGNMNMPGRTHRGPDETPGLSWTDMDRTSLSYMRSLLA